MPSPREASGGLLPQGDASRFLLPSEEEACQESSRPPASQHELSEEHYEG